MKVPTPQESTHPPPFVCIQSVYVGKKDEEKDSEDGCEDKKPRSRRNKKMRALRRRKILRESDDYGDDEYEDDLPQWNRSGRRWNRLRSFLSRFMT